ncbi:Proprotein convertase subtilisin/kexin type 5 [Collichthys lucidus]|uniref:Proprotein convertase subtilisin/kexin type 5 n=1 Tax=Collichthys lucidus TaxID=240159 RepID=A0A4U5V3C4_COLLU|nr:Proprotein convertase subtilisin/kexin type 5 [Collichthys lucidus]
MVSVNVQSEACQGRTDEINTLEHVQKAWVRPSLRGVIDGRVAVVTRCKQERAVSLFAAWRLSLRCAIVTPDVLLVMNRDRESVYWVRVSINAVCRGDLSISLESPAGTVSLLLDTRPNDASSAGLVNWTMMTVHCWDEQPHGLWTLKIYCPLCDQLPRPSVSQRRGGNTVKQSHITTALLITRGPRRVTVMLATRIRAHVLAHR